MQPLEHELGAKGRDLLEHRHVVGGGTVRAGVDDLAVLEAPDDETEILSRADVAEDLQNSGSHQLLDDLLVLAFLE